MKQAILIIEHDAFLAGIFARKFETDGWKVHVADDFEEGKRILEKREPSVVILEPDIDKKKAVAFIKFIRREPKTSTIPVLIFSTIGEKKEIDLMKSAGADAYLIKGHFVPSEAVKKVKAMLVGNKV